MREQSAIHLIFRNRWINILGLLVVLICLVLYGYLSRDPVTLDKCLNNPIQYDGKDINVSIEATVVKLLSDGFFVRQMGRAIRVVGDPQNASVGDFVVMLAVFHKEGYLELKSLRVAKGRRLKVLISIPPALLVLFLLFWTYRFDLRLLLFKERI
ncbi:MAG: hypothetical protein ACETWK_08565 [Candidatus Aminicenantaceae bacterium]